MMSGRAFLTVRRIMGWVAGGFILAFLVGYIYPDRLVTMPYAPEKCDVVVILGGEPENRTSRGVELYRNDIAPRILVTGRGDHDQIRSRLILEGVPEDRITVEKDSQSTFENAANSVPLLDNMAARRVLIVTSWSHERRALNCFRFFRPNVRFAVTAPPREGDPRYSAESFARAEYLKLFGYWIRYGIYPF
jgi:uncharacterized SAM-binding protein YcdF (DUF218 family)